MDDGDWDVLEDCQFVSLVIALLSDIVFWSTLAVDLPKVWPVISAMVGNGKSVIVASRGKKPELLAAGLESDSSSSRP